MTGNEPVGRWSSAPDEPVLVAFTRLPTYGANRAGGWRVVTIARYAEVVAPVREMFFQAAWIVLLALDRQLDRGHRDRAPHGCGPSST